MTEVPTRLLRTALGRTDEKSPDCLDAATLAAWADGGLTRDERTAVESHASGCARCQAMLAAMVRSDVATTYDAPSTETRLRNLFGLRWLVPIAAAAVVVAMGVAVPRRMERSVTSTSAGPAAPDAQQALRNAAPAAVQPPSTITSDQPRQRESREDRSKETATSKTLAPLPQPAAAPRSSDERVADTSDAARSTSAPQAAARAEAVQRQPPPPPLQAAQSAAPAAPTAATAAPSPTTSELAKPIDGRATTLAAARAFSAAAAPTTAILSLDGASRWRAIAPGSVDRSTDGGATWESLPTGVAVMLSAGASPSRDVCWMVGPRGTVVLSTDGRLWRRVPFPETIDLVAVRASDAANATVSTRDGRLFVTRDGGATWQSP